LDAHVDLLAAYPQNDFVSHLLPFLKKVKKLEEHGRPAH
jgi:hypothetical protein